MSILNWAELERTCVPPQAGPGPRYAMKQAYYHGVSDLLHFLNSFQPKTETDLIEALEAVQKECLAVFDEPGPRKGQMQ